MSEVKLKLTELDVYEKEYKEKIYKEIKFWDLGKNRYVEVEKLYQEPMVREGEKDGKKWKINSTKVKYLGEEVSVNISESALPRWIELPLGIVQVSKQEVEGKYGVFTTYKFQAGSRKEVDDNESLPF